MLLLNFIIQTVFVIAPLQFISITEFGASPDLPDNTAAIQSALDAAQAQGKAVFVPPGTFRHAGNLRVTGVTLSGAGDKSVLAGTDRGAMAIIMRGDGPAIKNLKLVGSAGERLSAYEACGIAVLGATRFSIEQVAVELSAAAGIHISGSSNGVVKANMLQSTAADSIHLSNFEGPNTNVRIERNRIEHSGDDGIAVVSYENEHAASHEIDITDNVVLQQAWGRGYAVVGGYDIRISQNYFDGNLAGFAGIYIASESAWKTLGVDRVTVTGNVVKNAGGTHGAVHVYADSHPVRDVTIDNNFIYRPKGVSVVVNGKSEASGIQVNANQSFRATPDRFAEMKDGKTIQQSKNVVRSDTRFPRKLLAAPVMSN